MAGQTKGLRTLLNKPYETRVDQLVIVCHMFATHLLVFTLSVEYFWITGIPWTRSKVLLIFSFIDRANQFINLFQDISIEFAVKYNPFIASKFHISWHTFVFDNSNIFRRIKSICRINKTEPFHIRIRSEWVWLTETWNTTLKML